MKKFLEQLGFEDITPDNPLDMMYLNEYFDYKLHNALYRRAADNGIITYIMHSNEGMMHYVTILSKYGYKWEKAQQLVPSDYIMNVTFNLLTSTEASVIRL